MSLARLFRDHLPRTVDEDAPGLEALLTRVLAAGRATWPGVGVGDEIFVRYLAERTPPDRAPLEAVATMHTTDLFLACGCVHGDAVALRAFDSHFVTQVSAYLGRPERLPGFTDDIKQELRQRLLLSESGLLPRIASYAGQGPLGGWVRIVTARLASEMLRQGGRHALLPLTFDMPGPDPELDYLKLRYHRHFEEAFQQAVATLPARDRTWLRLRYVEGLPPKRIASLYQVVVRTVRRRLVHCQRLLRDETRRRLGATLGLPSSQVDSLMSLLRSQLDVRLEEHLSPQP